MGQVVSVNLQLVSTSRCQTIVTHFGVRCANIERFQPEPTFNLFASHFHVWLKNVACLLFGMHTVNSVIFNRTVKLTFSG